MNSRRLLGFPKVCFSNLFLFVCICVERGSIFLVFVEIVLSVSCMYVSSSFPSIDQ